MGTSRVLLYVSISVSNHYTFLERKQQHSHLSLSRCSQSLINLHWIPVSFRIDFKILLIIYEILNGLALFIFTSAHHKEVSVGLWSP